VFLNQSIAAHWVVCRVNVSEVLGRSELLGMKNRVRGDVILLQKFFFEIAVELIPCTPRVRKCGPTPCALGRQLVRQQ